jgi:hypothetical protein
MMAAEEAEEMAEASVARYAPSARRARTRASKPPTIAPSLRDARATGSAARNSERVKFTVKRAGKLWLISRDGATVVGLSSKAEATKRAKAMQKKNDDAEPKGDAEKARPQARSKRKPK